MTLYFYSASTKVSSAGGALIKKYQTLFVRIFWNDLIQVTKFIISTFSDDSFLQLFHTGGGAVPRCIPRCDISSTNRFDICSFYVQFRRPEHNIWTDKFISTLIFSYNWSWQTL